MILAAALALSPADWTKLPASVKPAVEDTYIEQTTPDANYGRSEVLLSGLGRTILIRKSDLAVQVGPGEKITEASLLFTTSEPISPEVTEIGLVTAPWFEGSGRAQGQVPSAESGRWGATWNSARAGDGGSRWQRGGATSDTDREPITGLTTTFELGAFRINGLGPALQKMIDNPGKYTGITFTTKGRAQFLSSEFGQLGPIFDIVTAPFAKGDGPDLDVVEISPTAPMRTAFPGEGQPITWEAKIRNVGTQDSGPATAQWLARWGDVGTGLVPALKPGAEAIVKIDFGFKDQADKRFWPLSVRVDVPGDVNPRNNFTEIHVGAIPIAVVQDDQPASAEAQTQAEFRRFVEMMNTHVFPMSRFGFAPEGLTERVRYVSDPGRAMVVVEASALDKGAVRAAVEGMIGLPAAFFTQPVADKADDLPLVGLTADNRDEWAYPGGVPYPERLWPPRIFGQPMMPESGLLGRGESSLLMLMASKAMADRNAAKVSIPNVVILRTYDAGGRPIKLAKASIYQPQGGVLGEPLFTGETDRFGSLLVVSRSFTDKRDTLFGNINPDGSNAWLYVEFETLGEKAGRWIPWTQLVEEHRRGSVAAATIEYRMMLSDQPVDRTQNLVKGKSVEDSFGRFPAELLAVNDEDLTTATDFPGEGAWVEFDLGRDRAIGEVELVFTGDVPWESFVIQVYNTSQQPDAARAWIVEEYGAMRAGVQGGVKDGRVRLRYTGGSTNARYLRIFKLKGEAKLADVFVHPVVGG